MIFRRLTGGNWTACAAMLLALCLGLPGCWNVGVRKDPPVKKDDPKPSGSDGSRSSDSDDSQKIWSQMRSPDRETPSTGLSDKSRQIEKDLGVQ
jgi:hypothetical protein